MTQDANPAVAQIFIVDDHSFLRLGLRQYLESEPDLNICGEIGHAQGAVEAILEANPDLVIIDLNLPDGSGLELIKDLRTAGLTGKIVVLTIYDESLGAERAIRAGANGYLTKDADCEQFLVAIRAVFRGEIYLSDQAKTRLLKEMSGSGKASSELKDLSDREIQVLELIGAGLTTRAIATRLAISSKTVSAHRANIRKKVGISVASELVRFAVIHFGYEIAGGDSAD